MINNFTVQKTIVRHTDGSYLILRRSDTDVIRPLDWDLPGGMLDPDEKLEDGAMREIDEEAGKKLGVTHFLPRYTVNTMTEIDGETCNYLKIIYVAQASSKEVTLSYEHDLYEWVDQAEFIQRFESQPRYHKAIRYIIDNKLDVLA